MRLLRRRTSRSFRRLLRSLGLWFGRVLPLEQGIVDGRGRIKIGDAFWVVEGPDLATGTHVRITGTDGVNLHVEAA